MGAGAASIRADSPLRFIRNTPPVPYPPTSTFPEGCDDESTGGLSGALTFALTGVAASILDDPRVEKLTAATAPSSNPMPAANRRVPCGMPWEVSPK